MKIYQKKEKKQFYRSMLSKVIKKINQKILKFANLWFIYIKIKFLKGGDILKPPPYIFIITKIKLRVYDNNGNSKS